MANMMSNTKLWSTIGGVSIISILYAGTNMELSRLLRLSQPGSIWRILAVVFALLNLKNMPFAWHIRLFGGLFQHIFFTRLLPPKAGPAALFQPVITSSRSPVLECDYNFHKSNSTYFTDLDVSRMHHLGCLMKIGMHKARAQIIAENKGKFGIYLGGVTCNFRKEIMPYQGFEVWTRVLSWDRKWLYLASHIVKRGAVKPRSYVLQPWKNGSKSKSKSKETKEEKTPHPAIFATSVAKYVFKQGRLTLPPEVILQASGFLPERPADHKTPSTSVTPDIQGSSMDVAAGASLHDMSLPKVDATADASLEVEEVEVWTWERVEQERVRGLRIAEFMAGLEELQDEFTAGDRPALGQF